MQVWCGKRKPRCWHTGTSWNQYQKKGRHKKTDTLPDNKMPGQKYFMMQSGEKDLCLHQRHLKGFHHTKGFLVEYEPVFRAVGLAARILGLENKLNTSAVEGLSRMAMGIPFIDNKSSQRRHHSHLPLHQVGHRLVIGVEILEAVRFLHHFLVDFHHRH